MCNLDEFLGSEPYTVRKELLVESKRGGSNDKTSDLYSL